MSSPGSGWMRVIRGSTLSGLALALSLFAHVAAGGAVHITPIMVVFGLLLSAMCVAAADTRATFLGILSVVGVSQVVLHLLAGASGHEHGVNSASPPGLAMVVLHAVAAVAISAVLAYGERLVWALCGLVRLPRVGLLLRLNPPGPTRPGAPAFLPPPVRHGTFPDHGAGWRGPPAVLN